ncbi:hypothetical protein NQ315_004343 [Exocentrus adspersus]|uniref:Bestrophin homolog n=1 Tax=Exocentrus adspersus TaxID=1586481 RepID=A0AAV8W7E7_9CUCU|nr:hypothetical protein NQ315_004343 [Exocentrus adspersus]
MLNPKLYIFFCFRWRGSVYKLVWRELLAYLFIYYTVNLVYRFALSPDQQRIFEKIRMYFGQQSETIPMSFVLGFYVSLVVKRWWEQYRLLPWPDTLALFLNAGIPGSNERQRLMRRNIVRYAVLAYVITLQRISLRVKKRFPSWQHVVDSGLMMESERKIFELMDQKTPMSKYWMPLVWATNIINRARKESLITSDHIVQTLLMELSDIRRRLGSLIGYDTVNVPLVYTQVVSLALYVYFIAALLGRQFIPFADKSMQNKWEEPDMYFPFFTSLQFCFYIGWLKVAEVLINPFGEDDDDIELNWLIDRHIKAAYMIVDEMHEEHPELLKDQYWDDVVPKDLPYTVASEHYRKEEPKGSADFYKVKTMDAMYANLVTPKKIYSARRHVRRLCKWVESVDTPIVERRKSSNWFSRQISRTGMGSIRSASTAYSSGGLFTRHRGNSVYANPENGQLPGMPVHQKMSIYDRLVGRKSGRSRTLKSTTKFSGAAAMQVKNRPRIPTPDVTKEVVDRENRLAASVASVQNQMSTGLTLMPHQLPANYTAYPTADVPVVQVVLSPIQELDGSGSVNNTLHANQPGTAALAQAVLSPGLGPVLATPVSLPMTVSQLTSLETLRSSRQAFEPQKSTTPTLTDIHPDDEPPLSCTSSTATSEISNHSKDSIISNLTNTTASLTSKRSLEIPPDPDEANDVPVSIVMPQNGRDEAGTVSIEMPPTLMERTPSFIGTGAEAASSSVTPSASAPNSLVSLGGVEGARARKISTISQSTGSNSPKREVYV